MAWAITWAIRKSMPVGSGIRIKSSFYRMD